ncbi:MAG: hypothetical protein Q8Q09_11090 [Deltaproteobacteria bacterium]|nr:hypothetical protein [Deltaproteobacteria bacterium]
MSNRRWRQGSTSYAGEVMQNPTVQPDGSVLFVVREAASAFVLRLQFTGSTRVVANAAP